MEPQFLKENFSKQLEKIEKEVSQLRRALAQRQELALKLQGAIEAVQLQLGEESDSDAEDDVVEEAMAAETEVADQ